MAEVIFARVPAEVRVAVDAYVKEEGMTLAAGVADLLTRGLEAAASEASVVNLEQSVGALRAQLGERDRELREERARVAATEERERNLRSLVGQLDQAPIGHCKQPGCHATFTAIDLVVRRSCKKGHALTHVLEQAGKAQGVDTGELLVAIAALGLVLGLLAAGSKG